MSWIGKVLAGGASIVGLTATYRYLTENNFFGRPGLQVGNAIETRILEDKWLVGGPSAMETSGFDIYLRPHNRLESLTRSVSGLFTPFPGMRVSPARFVGPPVAAGGLLGFTTGAGLGLILGRGGAGRAVAALSMGLVGAAVGGYHGARLALGTAKVMNQVAAAYHGLDRTLVDRTARGGGRGYRSWMKRPGGRMVPGHLGATGDLPLALHKVRHKSLI